MAKYTDEIIKKFLDFIEKEKSLTAACTEMNMNPYEILGLVNFIKSKGINIAMKNTTDDIYMVNMGDYEFVEKNDLIPSLLQCKPLSSKDERFALSFIKLYRSKKNREAYKNYAFVFNSSAIEYIDKRVEENNELVAVTSSKKL